MEEGLENKGKNKNMWFALGLATFALIVYFLLAHKTYAPKQLPLTNNQNPLATTSLITKPKYQQSYAKALAKYRDKRIQLDESCQATPTQMTLKNNTNIMIDNRAPADRKVRVGDILQVKAYDFKIVNIASDNLPSVLLIDCASSQNVATILIEK